MKDSESLQFGLKEVRAERRAAEDICFPTDSWMYCNWFKTNFVPEIFRSLKKHKKTLSKKSTCHLVKVWVNRFARLFGRACDYLLCCFWQALRWCLVDLDLFQEGFCKFVWMRISRNTFVRTLSVRITITHAGKGERALFSLLVVVLFWVNHLCQRLKGTHSKIHKIHRPQDAILNFAPPR